MQARLPITIQNALRMGTDNDQELSKELDQLLQDPYNSQFQTAIKELFEDDQRTSRLDALGDTVATLLRGALGYYLFAYFADQGEGGRETANSYLQIGTVRAFLFQKYDLPGEYRNKSITLHRVGTTSYILRIADIPPKAIKLIKYRYLNNPSITDNTANYRNQFLKWNAPNTPEIFEVDKGYIIMRFIEGETLREYLKMLWKDDVANSANGRVNKKETIARKIPKVIEIIDELCLILDQYAQNGLLHLDLSPDNILLERPTIDRGRENRRIYLIDFGFNYLLNEGVGFTPALLRAQTYIAPELLDAARQERVTSLADVYSLGIILLEMLNGLIEPVAARAEHFSTQDIPQALDRIRSRHIGLGMILLDLLDENPKSRVFDHSQDQHMYKAIKERVDSELTIFEKIYLRRDPRWVTFLVNVLALISPSVDVIARHIKEGLSGLGSSDRRRAILAWCTVAEIANTITLLGFAYYLSQDYTQNTLLANLPGRAVALSFSFVGTKYYVNIFGTLSAKGMSRVTEFFMRANAICFAFPIWYTLFVNPKAWGIAAGTGSILTTLNNYLTYRLAVRSRKELENAFGQSMPISIDGFIDEYRNWYQLMGQYGVMLMAIGLSIRFGIVQDEIVYASITIFVNWKMLRYNCSGDEADRIRGGLEYAIASLARASRYKEYLKRGTAVAPRNEVEASSRGSATGNSEAMKQ